MADRRAYAASKLQKSLMSCFYINKEAQMVTMHRTLVSDQKNSILVEVFLHVNLDWILLFRVEEVNPNIPESHPLQAYLGGESLNSSRKERNRSLLHGSRGALTLLERIAPMQCGECQEESFLSLDSDTEQKKLIQNSMT